MNTRQGLDERLRGTRDAVVAIALFAPTLALSILSIVGLGTAVLGVGIVLLVVAVPLMGLVADVHRAAAARILATDVRADYAVPQRPGVLARLSCWSQDRTRWRDQLWALCSITAGFVLSWLPVALLLAVVWYAVFPLVWGLSPEGVFEDNFGIVHIDTQAKSFLEWGFGLLALGLWWWWTPALVRARARLDRALLAPDVRRVLEERVGVLSRTRAESSDHAAAELRRVERDLHDGAQARLVALGMSLGMAEQMLDGDPEAARAWLADARGTTISALTDLRAVVRGIVPPVLADRGLAGAVHALALDLPLPVTVTGELPERPPAALESAAYFAVSECLTNVVRHSSASRAWVVLGAGRETLWLRVGDDGHGGAVLGRGSGLPGIERRLAAFDGTITVTSPPGGPTEIAMELPCAWSSARTSPSSGTA